MTHIYPTPCRVSCLLTGSTSTIAPAAGLWVKPLCCPWHYRPAARAAAWCSSLPSLPTACVQRSTPRMESSVDPGWCIAMMTKPGGSSSCCPSAFCALPLVVGGSTPRLLPPTPWTASNGGRRSNDFDSKACAALLSTGLYAPAAALLR